MALKNPRRGEDRPLTGPVLSSRLPAMLAELKAEESWDEKDRNSRTVYKSPGLRVVLLAMHAGATLAAHKVAGPITIQVVEGDILLRAKGEALALSQGALVHLGASVPHDVEAKTEAAVLITIGAAP